MAATITSEISERQLAELERALRLPCEMPVHETPDVATWQIEVRHGPVSCGVERMLICSHCRDGLHRQRHAEIECPTHGPLGYSVQRWWRPLGTV